MRKKTSPLRHLILLLVVGAALVVGVGAWRTLTVVGEAAVASMDSAERSLLQRIGRLDRGMTREEVEAVLGPPDHWTQLGADQRGNWLNVPGAPLARVTVHLDSGAASRVRWLKLGYFTYELELPPRG